MNDNEKLTVLKGVVHGKTIELEEATGLPDGQSVTVRIESISSTPLPSAHADWAEAKRRLEELREQFKDLPPGEGLRRAFGAMADHAEEMDRLVEEAYNLRLVDRPLLNP
jgi:hypothetical protein